MQQTITLANVDRDIFPHMAWLGHMKSMRHVEYELSGIRVVAKLNSVSFAFTSSENPGIQSDSPPIW